MLKPLLERLLLAYGLGTPYHRGKWRVIEACFHRFGLAGLYADGPREVKRAGVTWRLNPVSLVQRAVYFLGGYELQETRWLLEQARPDWTFLDVGANFGYYSLRVSQATAGRATVHAFEPASALHETLAAQAKANRFDRLTAHRAAVSDREGELELLLPPAGNEGIGRLRQAEDAVAGRVEKVPAVSLDGFAEREGLERVDFIKIDVEGAECQVLDGARRMLERFRPRLMVEVNPDALRGFGVSARDLLGRLRALGYTPHRLRHGRLEPLTDDADLGDYVNAICLPR